MLASLCITGFDLLKFCVRFLHIPYFAVYMCLHIFGPNFQRKKSFKNFNSINYLFIYLYLDTWVFLYYKGNLAFIFEHIMVQEILFNKQLQNIRYFTYYLCIINILIFSSKIWAKKCALYMAKYRYVNVRGGF